MWARLPDPDETESGDFSFLFVVVAARSDGSCWTPFLDPILDLIFGPHFWNPILVPIFENTEKIASGGPPHRSGPQAI